MVSDQQIAETLDSLLRNSNPNSFSSFNDVVQQLESKLGFDLSPKIDFISSQIQIFYGTQPPPPPPQQHQRPLQAATTSFQNQHNKDHFAPIQNPNYPPSPSQLPPNYAVQHSGPSPTSRADPDASVVTPEVSKQSGQTGTKRKGGPGGLNKLCGVSPELQAIVGQPAMPRTEIVKQLWAYIRKNNLQDPSNKRKIICNDELRLVFETDCTDMFKMNKLLAKHIIPLEPSKPPAQKKKKADLVQKVLDIVPVAKNADPGPSVAISEALSNFFGDASKEMLQAEVLRRIWQYINDNNLEDPEDHMVILCDAKLQELLGCRSITVLGLPEMLARRHLFKI